MIKTKEYEYPLCENCQGAIPRGWDTWRDAPEVPSAHLRRKTCSPECHSQLMAKKRIGQVTRKGAKVVQVKINPVDSWLCGLH